MSATEILKEIRRLPVEKQREVVQRIRDEFAEEPTPEQIAKFEERAERLRRNPEIGISWDKMRKELKGRLEQRRACHEK